uniref:Uncharacterized protein n=1 Tax=Takifugu rubripes TaxID=31033 RepID=A0A674P6Q8_TAKRU
MSTRNWLRGQIRPLIVTGRGARTAACSNLLLHLKCSVILSLPASLQTLKLNVPTGARPEFNLNLSSSNSAFILAFLSDGPVWEKPFSVI